MSEKTSLADFLELTDTQRMNILWSGIAELWNRVAELEKQGNTHERVLITGDGDKELSAMERLRNVEKYLEAWRYWTRFIGGALIIQTIAFVITLIVAIVRFLPLLERIASQTK